MDLRPGTRLGPYEIASSIGAGGMGEVYRATDTRLGRTVAIKVLSARLADEPQARERFLVQRLLAGRMSSPITVDTNWMARLKASSS